MTVDGPHHTVADGYYCDVYPSGKRADGEPERNRRLCAGVRTKQHACINRGCGPAMEESADEISSAIAEVLTGGGT